ncbi:MAG: nucleotidyltransferase domain-containing protein [Oscillospiraceae bacterium]|nr:nucleotidyltransferase domain-containing protein [Oscillospiraceae bacterium]
MLYFSPFHGTIYIHYGEGEPAMSKIYTLSELQTLLAPVFVRYGVRRAVLFGSYAKGQATEQSDVDLLVDSGLRGLAFYGLLRCNV